MADSYEQLLHYEVDKKDLALVEKALQDEPLRAKRIIANSLNKQAGSTKNKMKTAMQSVYTVKTGGVNARVKINRASPNHLEAILGIGGRTLTLGRFHTTAPKSGARAEVVKGAGLKVLEKVGTARITKTGFSSGIRAFKAKGLIMQRRGFKRKPLKALRGPSVPKMMEQIYQGKRGNGPTQDQIQQHLHDEVLAQLRK